MISTSTRGSKDDQHAYRAHKDTRADLIDELSKSVARLRSLSVAENGDASQTKLEHTFDAILNVTQKTTFDDSLTLHSLRIARPVRKRNKQQEQVIRDKGGRLTCGLRLLWCGKSEGKEDDFTTVSPDQISNKSKLWSRSRVNFWKREQSKMVEKGGGSNGPQQSDCDASNGYSNHSKEDLVVIVERKNPDDISSLGSDLYVQDISACTQEHAEGIFVVITA